MKTSTTEQHQKQSERLTTSSDATSSSSSSSHQKPSSKKHNNKRKRKRRRKRAQKEAMDVVAQAQPQQTQSKTQHKSVVVKALQTKISMDALSQLVMATCPLLKVERHATKGRLCIAKTALKAGTLVMTASPHVCSLEPEFRSTRCWHCWKEKKDAKSLKRCTGCMTARYCAQACQRDDWLSQHRYECKALQRNALVLWRDFLVIRQCTRSQSKDHKCEQFNCLFEKRKANGMAFEQRPRSAFRKLSTSDDQLRKWYEQILTNAITVIDETGGTIVGRALYLTPSLLNHACQPSCLFHYVGNQLHVVTMRDVKAGEALTVSYIGLRKSNANRRFKLNAAYSFYCNCERCSTQQGWLTDARYDGIRCVAHKYKPSAIQAAANGNRKKRKKKNAGTDKRGVCNGAIVRSKQVAIMRARTQKEFVLASCKSDANKLQCVTCDFTIEASKVAEWQTYVAMESKLSSLGLAHDRKQAGFGKMDPDDATALIKELMRICHPINRNLIILRMSRVNPINPTTMESLVAVIDSSKLAAMFSGMNLQYAHQEYFYGILLMNSVLGATLMCDKAPTLTHRRCFRKGKESMHRGIKFLRLWHKPKCDFLRKEEEKCAKSKELLETVRGRI